MELVSTMEINGEEREIADAYARGKVEGINSNLSQLEFGENCGGKNLFDPSTLLNANYDENTDTITVSNNTNKALDMVFKENTQYTFSAYIKQSISSTNNRLSVKYTDGTTDNAFLYTQSTSEVYISATSKIGKTISEVKWYYGSTGTATFRNLQIEEGTTSTNYEPYIPSVKMLADENAQQNTEAMDLKMLGWSVPIECPVQNYVDSDGVFHQRVGRVDLGSLNWTDNGDHKIWYTQPISNSKVDSTNGYCKGFEIVGYIALGVQSIVIHHPSGNSYIKFTNEISDIKQALQGVYLYYELAEEKTISVDGNEAVTKLKNDLSNQCKKDDITTNETLIGTFNGKNYYRKLFTGIGASGSSITVNVGEKIEIYNYYGRAYTYGQSGASDVKYPIPNKNYYIESQNASETSFQLTIPTSSDTRKVDLVIEYTKVDE